MRLIRLALLSVIIISLGPSIVQAGTTGKLSGRVIDEATGAPLPGVNVFLTGTRHGASSGTEGQYFVLNIEPGTYEVRFQMIGYSRVVVENVRITADLTTEISLELTQQVLDIGEEVIVTAERPLIQRDVTATQTVLLADDIINMPVNSFTEVLTVTAGVVSNSNGGGATGGDNGIHIRGGRSKEIAYMVDGFFVEDALYGGSGIDVSDMGIAELSIITGSFNAEYGEAMSGIVNIITKDGSGDYKVSLWGSTDQWSRLYAKDDDQLASDWGSSRYKATLGGPVPFLNTNALPASFYLVGDIYKTSGYLGRTIIQRTSYKSNEDWVDLNGNSEYDDGEPYTDANSNGQWDGEIAYAGGHYLDEDGNAGFLNPEDVNYYPLKRGEFRRNDTYTDRTRLNSKIVLRPINSIKFVLGGAIERQERRPFSTSFREIQGHTRLIWKESDLYNATMTHTLSPNTFYTLKFAKFTNRNVEGMKKILDKNHKLILYEDFSFDGDPRGDGLDSLWSYNAEPFNDTSGNSVYNIGEDFLDLNGNGVWDGGIISPLRVLNAFDGTSNYEFWGAYPQLDADGDTVRWLVSDDNFYRDYKSVSTTYGGAFTSQLNDVHQIKFGGELRLYELENFWISGLNTTGGSFIDYKFEPVQAEIYIQDKMEFSDMILNLGIRADYLNPKSKYIDDPRSPLKGDDYEAALDSLPKADVKIKISPRIGIGYPVTDKMLFHFSYGQFYQSPEFNQLYARTNQNSDTNPVAPFPYNISQGYIPTVGNPNLQPETTVAYEFGVQSMLTDDMVAKVTLFYKDIYDYVTSTIFDADPVQYAIFLNNDYGNSRGIEMGLKRRYSNRFEGSITYTFSKAEGNSGNEFTHWNEAYSASVLGTVPAQKTITLPWDQPHMLNLLMDYRAPSNWGINIIGSYGSGLPYTATDSRGRALDERNSSRLPATLNMDVRLNKDFYIGKIRYRLYSDILNFFNRQNVNSVFSTTGKPNESANPNSSIEIQDRPEFYAPPRSIEVGLQINFR